MTELKDVLQARINNAIARNEKPAMMNMMKLIEQEENIIDRLVPSSELVFGADDESARSMLSYMKGPDEGESYFMHKNAVTQLSTIAGVPSQYLTGLVSSAEKWKRDLGCRMLNDHIDNLEKKRTFFLRAVGGEARAVLSSSYKPINAAPIFAAFKSTAQQNGAIMFDAHLSDLRAYLEVIDPNIFSIETPNNGTIWVAFGMRISSSDFGAGALDVRTMFWQGMCMNGAVASREMHKVHLGQQLDSKDFNFSKKTIDSSLTTMISAVQDVARATMHPNRRNDVVNHILNASSKEVDLENEVKLLPKRGWTKEEAELINKELVNSNPEHGVTGGPTKFKMQQAMTWVANGLEAERKREAQLMAGEYILN